MNIITNKSVLSNDTILNNRYKITGLMGEGGFGITYKAIHIEMQKEIAIKEFFCRDYMSRDAAVTQNVKLQNPDDRKRLDHDLQKFLQEAKTLSELSGIPGIVHVTDFFKENGTAYIVMELVRGVSLEELLKKGRIFTEKEILTYFLPLMKSLSAVHERGLIHRDIKPGNLIVSDNGNLTLIDFGTAVSFAESKVRSVYLTEGYAPYEQYSTRGTLGPYTDVYALCAVIYQCITGIIPEDSRLRMSHDTLAKPSEVGIQLSDGFENILMKGLEIDAGSRWQTMDDLYNAFSSLLPAPPKRGKLKYMIIGVLAAFIAVGIWYGVSHFDELAIHHQEMHGEAITFNLEAPEEMTANEFNRAVNIIRERVSVFTGGKNFLIDTQSNDIGLTIPIKYFSSEDDIEYYLKSYFAFDGKWLLHNPENLNSDRWNYMELTPDNIVSVKLKHGEIPVTISDAEYPYSATEFTPSESQYYLKMELNDTATDFLHDTLNKEGYIFSAVEYSDNNGSFIYRLWISGGDGKTVYFPQDDKTEAKMMQTILSSGTFSSHLELTWENEKEEAKITWKQPDSQNSLLCQPDDFKVPTVEISYETSGEETDNVLQLCEKQLEILNIPYALGQNESTVYIRVPSDKINQFVLSSLGSATIELKSEWNNRNLLDYYDIDNAEVEESDNKEYLTIYLTDNNTITDNSNNTSDLTYLYIAGIRIGKLDESDLVNRKLTYELLLPQNAEDMVISSESMAKYICSLVNSENLYSSLSNEVWRDKSGNLLPYADIPDIPVGTDLTRFSDLFSVVKNFGGEAKLSSDYEEEIDIIFNDWTGSFPDEALEMCKTIFDKGKLADNICSTVHFTINTWYKGDPVRLSVFFNAEASSKSVICTGGQVSVNDKDKSLLEEAKSYIENNSFFTPSDDRSYNADGSLKDEYASSFDPDWLYMSTITDEE